MSDGELRVEVLSPDDERMPEFSTAVRTVFHANSAPTPESLAYTREAWVGSRISAAFDGKAVVGTFRSWDWQLTVPGGSSATANAISAVTVLPTHRRRGAMDALMRSDLAAAAERGTVAACLIAARATIYGRFGFGPSTRSASWTIDASAAHLRDTVPAGGSVRLVSGAELRQVAPEIFERARRPGATERRDLFWDLLTGQRVLPGESARFQGRLLHRDIHGVPQGYAIYSWKEDWDRWQPRTTLTLNDLFAATPQAYAELFRVLVSIDNVATVKAERRPVDEPLPWMLTDHRALRIHECDDFLWTRILNVPQALSLRTYEMPGQVTFAVRDPLGNAQGVYQLTSESMGTGLCARVTMAEPDADLVLDLDVLSSVWLGGGDLVAAAQAGRVQERTSGALALLARMMHTPQAPWTEDWF